MARFCNSDKEMLPQLQGARLFSLLWANLLEKPVTFPDSPHPLCQGIDVIRLVLEDNVGSMQIIRKISSYGKCKQQDLSIISASGLWRGLWRKDPPMELQLLIQLLPGQ